VQKYLIRRFLATVPIVLLVGTMSFFLMQVAAGDAVGVIIDEEATREQEEALRDELGLNDPVLVQFARWVGDLFRGDLGTSLISRYPVTRLMAPRLEPTLSIAFLGTILSVLLGIPLGLLAAWRPNSGLDRAVLFFSVIGFSVPGFWLAFLALWTFSVKLSLFPVLGYTPISEGILPWVRGITLPAIVISVSTAAVFARMTRTGMVEVLQQDYIRTAKAKGLGERIVHFRHAFKNASIPVITTLGFLVVGLATGTTIIEIVFTIPGLGRLLVTAVVDRDYPIVHALLMLTALVYIYVNLLTDILYAYADPRIRY
jgi:peptide/nickel transport system permease protein